jgi:hypothetical protein
VIPKVEQGQYVKRQFSFQKTLFDSSWPPVVCRRTHFLFYVICVCLPVVVSNTSCVVFFLFLLFFCLRLVYHMLVFSLDCPFLIDLSVFSGLSFSDWPFGILYRLLSIKGLFFFSISIITKLQYSEHGKILIKVLIS